MRYNTISNKLKMSSSTFLSSKVVSIKDLDITKITFSDPKNTANKAKVVDIFYEGSPLTILMPKLQTFVWNNEKSENKSVMDMDLLLKDRDTKPLVAGVEATIKVIDERVRTEAAINSVPWGISKKPLSVDAVGVFQYDTIRESIDGKYAPALKVKLRVNALDKTIACKVFDSNKGEMKSVNVSELRNANVATVLTCCLWITGGRFKTSYTVNQMRIFDKEVKEVSVVSESDAFLYSALDLSKVLYSNPMSMGNSGKIVYINYNGGKPIVMKTCKLHCPFGINVFVPEGGKPKYSVSLSFKDPSSKELKDVMMALDAKIQKDIVINAWFPGVTYQPIVRESAEYAPTMNLTLQCDDAGQPKFKMMDDEDNEFLFDPSMVHDFKGAKLSCVIQCTGIWQNGAKCGVSFKALTINVTPSQSGYVDIPDDDDDDNDDDVEV